MNIIIFDDEKRENFFPLTHNRITGDLRVGILKLRQRILAYFEAEEFAYIMAKELEDLYLERHPSWKINELSGGDQLLINSRIKINDKLVELIKEISINNGILCNGQVVAIKINTDVQKISSDDILSLYDGVEFSEIDAEFWDYNWELIGANSKFIEQDFMDFFYEKDNYFETEMGITVLNPYNIWIGEGAEIKPGVVIDASEGPVIIDEQATIMPNSVLTGPIYIGKNSTIKAGARIYEGTSIGPVCKVGGEVEETIFQGYSNKQHEGFLGHSYVGEWVNIGADTNNSDLKNNYGSVKVYYYPDQDYRDSGTQFQGAIIGDHTKIGINCSINTGTVIGLGCNLYGSFLISGFVPDFSWGMADNLAQYRLDKFLDTVEIVKKRRNLKLGIAEKSHFSQLASKAN